MRTGACTIQQTLTAEAASVLKHSLSLARRRGHAQVTPLHVAATLLSSRSSLLRRACLKSHPNTTNNYQIAPSHPLQCRALELCFNVALNRLPTIPGPMFHGQPSFSNALIAALKRAQAHQRRGCIEQQQQQQQPLLTIKVELEQLVVSILDDPSVSRVMREAGFSSTAVKNCVEDCSVSTVFYGSSVGVFSSPGSPSSNDHHSHRDFYQPIINPTTFYQTHFLNQSPEQNQLFILPQKKVFGTDSVHSLKEDVKLVIEVLLGKKKKNPVIVGDSMSLTESLVSELMGKIEKGDVHDDLKQTQLIKFLFSPIALKFMNREDVETNLSELRKKIGSLAACGKGAIVYTGDLKWTVSENNSEDQISASSSHYRALDHLVEEIGRLVTDYNNDNNTSSNTRVWVLGTASYQTYMRCQMRQPSLETQWSLQAVSVPSGGLCLSLHASSARESRLNSTQNPSQLQETKPFAGEEEESVLTCCEECTSNYEKEAKVFKSCQEKLLPSWLQPHGDDSNQKDELASLRRKWNRFCRSLHRGRTNRSQYGSPLPGNQSLIGKSYPYALSYPCWPNPIDAFSESASISFTDSASKQSHRSSSSVAKFRRQNSCTIEFDLGSENHKRQTLDKFEENEGKEAKITLDLGRCLFSLDSGKSNKEKSEETTRDRCDLSKVFMENVPWQSKTLPSILEVLMDSLSSKKDAWILIRGNDTSGKRRLARTAAESLFGSVRFLVHIKIRKRGSEEASAYSEILASSLRNHRKLVVLVEDIDLADTHFMKVLADKFEGKSVEAEDSQVIFILTTDDSLRDMVEEKSQDSVIRMTLKVNDPKTDHKRKAESDLSSKTKNLRIVESEDTYSVDKTSSMKKDFKRQSSFNGALDLNMNADECDEVEVKSEQITPVLSDITREISSDLRISNGLLCLINNQFVFEKNVKEDREMREGFSSKIKSSLKEIFKGEKLVRFGVEEKVIDELCGGSGYFLNGLFENWLRDVFQTSLKTVKFGGKEGTGVIRLCIGGIVDKVLEGEGFMGTCLPRKVQVSYVEE